jgi:hypothetical protein
MSKEKRLESILKDIKDNSYGHPLTIAYHPYYLDLRTNYIEKYGWSLIDQCSLETIKTNTIGQKILDIGTGTGHWPFCLNLIGCDVIATDSMLQDSSWVSIEKLDAVSAVEKYNGVCSVLFCSWPEYNKDYAFEALRQFTGDTVIYIGEGKTGCCATDSFFDHLTQYFQKMNIENTLQSWPQSNDHLSIYKKK